MIAYRSFIMNCGFVSIYLCDIEQVRCNLVLKHGFCNPASAMTEVESKLNHTGEVTVTEYYVHRLITREGTFILNITLGLIDYGLFRC